MPTIYVEESRNRQVDEFGSQRYNVFLQIAYQSLYELEIRFVSIDPNTGAVSAVDVSDATAWGAAVAEDFDSTTDPMCRTLDADIDSSGAALGVIVVPFDANTATFLSVVDGRQKTECYFELRGYDGSANKVHSIILPIRALGSLDPTGGDPPDPVGDYYTKIETAALVDGKVAWTELPTAEYDASRSYDTNEFVTYAGTIYKSLQDSNTGNTPDSEPTWWEEYSAGTGGGGTAADTSFDSTGLTGPLAGTTDVQEALEAFDPAVETNAADIDTLEGEVADHESRIADLEAEPGSDWSGDPIKTAALSGDEKISIYDDTTRKVIRTGRFATAEHTHDFDLEYGFTEEASTDITNLTHLKPYIAWYQEDEPPSEDNVELLLHFSGSEGSTTIEDKSGNARTCTLTGTGTITEQVTKFGSTMSLPNDTSLRFEANGIDLASAAFTVSAYIQPTAGQEAVVHDIFRMADSVGAKRAVSIYLDSEQLHILLGCDDENGWTDHLQYPVTINPETFNHAMIQSDGSELIVGFEGEILDRYPLTGRFINAADSANWKIWIGDDSAGVYMDGYLDEIIFARSALIDIDAEDETYTKPADWYITRERRLDARSGMYYDTFVDADLASSILVVEHDLGRQTVHVLIADENGEQIIPDSVTFDSDSQLSVDLTSFGTISGVWTISILAWAIAANAVGGEATQDDIDALQSQITDNADAIAVLQASTATRVSVVSGDHVLATEDAGKPIDLEEDADQDITIATGVITDGFQVTLNGIGTGAKAFVAAAGVSLNGTDNATVTLGNQWGALLLRGIGDDAAVVQGDVA